MNSQNYNDEVTHIDLNLRSKRPSAESVRVSELEALYTDQLKAKYPDAKAIHACIEFYNHAAFGDGSLPAEKEMMCVIIANETKYISLNDLTR